MRSKAFQSKANYSLADRCIGYRVNKYRRAGSPQVTTACDGIGKSQVT